MTSSMPTTRDRRTAARERERLLNSCNHFWHLEDIAGPLSTRKHLLAELVEDGELRHVRRGLYWRGTKSPLGMSPPPTDALIHELAPGPGVGPTGLYAANLLRLSTQVPRRAEVAVPARAPESTGSVKFVTRAARKARVKAGLSPIEVAVLESLEAWERAIEVAPAEAWSRFRELLSSGQVRADRLARAGTTEPGTVRARLRALLGAAGRSDLVSTVPEPDRRTTAAATRLVPSTV